MIAVNGFLSLLQNQLGSSASNSGHTSGAAFEIIGMALLHERKPNDW